MTAFQIRSYLVDVLDRTSASTAVTRWGGLLAFFKWATSEGLAAADPMTDVDRPQRPELLTPVLTDDEVRAMFDTCDGSFNGLRDLAHSVEPVTFGERVTLNVFLASADEPVTRSCGRCCLSGARSGLPPLPPPSSTAPL